MECYSKKMSSLNTIQTHFTIKSVSKKLSLTNYSDTFPNKWLHEKNTPNSLDYELSCKSKWFPLLRPHILNSTAFVGILFLGCYYEESNSSAKYFEVLPASYLQWMWYTKAIARSNDQQTTEYTKEIPFSAIIYYLHNIFANYVSPTWISLK